jgi:hypothetical protein
MLKHTKIKLLVQFIDPNSVLNFFKYENRYIIYFD